MVSTKFAGRGNWRHLVSGPFVVRRKVRSLVLCLLSWKLHPWLPSEIRDDVPEVTRAHGPGHVHVSRETSHILPKHVSTDASRVSQPCIHGHVPYVTTMYLQTRPVCHNHVSTDASRVSQPRIHRRARYGWDNQDLYLNATIY